MGAAVLAAALTLTPIEAAAVIPPSLVAYEECVAHRESHRNPRAVNATGHAGIYQFAPAWRHGLPYMVRDRLVRFGMSATAARKVRITLSGLPIQKWPSTHQRIGFLEVVHRGGFEHWYIPGSRCNGLTPGGAR